MSETPQGWTSISILDAMMEQVDGRIIHQGWSPRCESTPSVSEKDWGALKTTAIQDGEFLSQYNKKLPAGLAAKPKLEVKKGDLLLTCAGPRIRCGVACLVRETRPKLFISGKMYRFRARDGLVSPVFLEAFLRAPETQFLIDGMKTGISESGMNITHDKFSKLIFPLAPLEEQIRIAEKLDALRLRVDAIKMRLDRIPLILKQFRQSVFNSAVSGALTELWREENKISDNWRECVIGDLIIGKPRNGYSPKPVEYPTDVKSLTLSATTSGKFLHQHFKYINEKISPNSHLWLRTGDILIQRANSLEYVGISVIFDREDTGYIYPDLMIKCRANEHILPDFLLYLLMSESTRMYFRQNATGTAGNMPKINQQTVINAPAQYPSLREQNEIVNRVKKLLSFADKIEARYNAARAHVDKLTPALLAKAFRGELVEQDPNDEPADKLLERIKANNKATAPATKKVAKRK